MEYILLERKQLLSMWERVYFFGDRRTFLPRFCIPAQLWQVLVAPKAHLIRTFHLMPSSAPPTKCSILQLKIWGPREGPDQVPPRPEVGPKSPIPLCWAPRSLQEPCPEWPGRVGHRGKIGLRRAGVRGVPTSIIKEPVDVYGLLALLRLEDGAGLLLSYQGLGVHCGSRGAGHLRAVRSQKSLRPSENRASRPVRWACSPRPRTQRPEAPCSGHARRGLAQITTSGSSDSGTLIPDSQAGGPGAGVPDTQCWDMALPRS